jgi:hypothetical protein
MNAEVSSNCFKLICWCRSRSSTVTCTHYIYHAPVLHNITALHAPRSACPYVSCKHFSPHFYFSTRLTMDMQVLEVSWTSSSGSPQAAAL